MHVFHFAVKVLPGPQFILSKAWRADRSNEAVYKLKGLTYQSYACYFLDLEGNLETLRGHCNTLSIRIYTYNRCPWWSASYSSQQVREDD